MLNILPQEPAKGEFLERLGILMFDAKRKLIEDLYEFRLEKDDEYRERLWGMNLKLREKFNRAP